MSKYIRIDDYPHGKPNYGDNYKTIVESWVKIFENYDVKYILGVTPLLLKEEDKEFLKKIIKNGKLVMHGFNHKFDHPKPWPTIIETWAHGGEFMGLSENNIDESYLKCKEIMSYFERYDESHFIPPFNCLTQNLLNVLSKNKISYIHTCDKEYNEYKYENLNFKNIIPVISKYHKGYDDIHKVINRLNDDNIGQITLHWIFDCEQPNWILNYENFAKKLNESTDYTGKW